MPVYTPHATTPGPPWRSWGGFHLDLPYCRAYNHFVLEKSKFLSVRLLLAGVSILIFNSIYLVCFASPNVFYVVNVFYHVIFGLILIPILFVEMGRIKRILNSIGGRGRLLGWLAYCLFMVSAFAGVALILWHNTRPNRWILHVHIATAVLATCLAVMCLIATRSFTQADKTLRNLWKWGLAVLCVGILIPALVLSRALQFTNPNHVIENPLNPPTSMEEESMFGKEGPFFPSAAETSTLGLIPSTFFMNSKSCGQAGCHPDIYKQWNSSAHHFSSFNNQWYRKSIEYMQAINGIQSSKWCAGCHDQAVLFNGMFDRPIQEIVDTPEAHAGIGCNGCHAIVGIKDTMGNGGYSIEYPPLHDLAASENPVLKFLHNFLVRVDPGPHKNTFMKPFHTKQTAEFCSSCHKVHLDKPVNNYRWLRGFNEYDNWQASGVSGQGARSFYYPEKPQKCADCHMPLIESDDAGNIDGFVHNHRFPGANTALPVANHDEEQLKVVTDFLKDNQIRVDIFAMSEPGSVPYQEESSTANASRRPRLASTFGVGEEQGMTVGVGGISGAAANIVAPLDGSNAFIRRGDSVRVDVVVRTLNVGHFFPGGTVDASDVWLEFKAVDDQGKTLYWSGAVHDQGKGPVEESAHFYRSIMLDGHGNPINKRNAWAARSTLYVNLIPPGASDVAHFRLTIPEDCGNLLHLTAKLNHRKFAWWYTQFSYAGVRDPNHTDFVVTPDFDDGRWLFHGDTRAVSGALKEIPDLPIVEMASDHLTFQVRPAEESLSYPEADQGVLTRERWNDYGIGLLRQGDLIGAERAFLKVTQIESDYADGWVNVGRVRLKAGDIEGATDSLTQALSLAPELPKTHYFYALALKSRGDYDEALKHLEKTIEAYPRDRVVRNQVGRIFFLQKKYKDAIHALQEVLRIDPEDLQAHYNLMLSYRGMGDMDKAIKEQTLYMRFKADESSQTITGAVRQENLEANNERQPIHEHVSVSLPWENGVTDTSREAGTASSTSGEAL
jgi:Flp pilus assembly protein TadD